MVGPAWLAVSSRFVEQSDARNAPATLDVLYALAQGILVSRVLPRYPTRALANFFDIGY
jgi:hypothetical protein